MGYGLALYVQGEGHEHLGPGTSMVEHINWSELDEDQSRGLGACCASCEGMGFFDSGLDPSGWAWPEWGTVALGAYVLMSTIFTTRRAVRSVGEGVRRTRKRIGKRVSGS